MATIQSATGPVDTSNLGFTLMHEHVLVLWPPMYQQYPELFDREAQIANAVAKLKNAIAAGVRTIVDLTPIDLGRDPRFIREAAEKSGMQIIVATGLCRVAVVEVHERRRGVLCARWRRPRLAGRGPKSGWRRPGQRRRERQRGDVGVLPLAPEALTGDQGWFRRCWRRAFGARASKRREQPSQIPCDTLSPPHFSVRPHHAHTTVIRHLPGSACPCAVHDQRERTGVQSVDTLRCGNARYRPAAHHGRRGCPHLLAGAWRHVTSAGAFRTTRARPRGSTRTAPGTSDRRPSDLRVTARRYRLVSFG